MNVNKLCNYCYFLFIFDIVYEKKLQERILGSSQKGHKYCFLLKKNIKIKTTLNVIVIKGQNKE